MEENIEEKCLEIKMPVMLLQPIYENAIKHGVYESTERVRIITVAKMLDGNIEIIISNNYDPSLSSRRGTGTGLQNVARRLELYYGNRASVITGKENNMISVKLYIPTDFE